jgi:hypothetical protein
VTFVQAAFIVPSVGCAIFVLWMMAHMPKQEEEAPEADDLDQLRWVGWSLSKGWPAATCWHGCADLHRDDWGRAYLKRTCWQGCADLHRDDWWKGYVDHADPVESTS